MYTLAPKAHPAHLGLRAQRGAARLAVTTSATRLAVTTCERAGAARGRQ
jgi:hypothetical protein